MLPNSFTAQLQQNPIQPSWVSGERIDLSSNLQLQWPTSFTTSANVVASIIEVNPLSTGLALLLGPADQVSSWTALLVKNVGSYLFSLQGAGGDEIVGIPSGEAYYVYLVDNTTINGTWNSINFGAGTASAVAADLAGYGLIATLNKLNINCPPVVLSQNTTIDPTYRGKLVVWGGPNAGTGALTFSQLDAGFFTYITNQSPNSGNLTVSPPTGWTINGLSSIPLPPGSSGQFISGGPTSQAIYMTGFSSLFGSDITVNSVTGLTGGELTLSASQMASLIQEFSGTLASDQTVYVEPVSNIYFVYNKTSGGSEFFFGMVGKTTYVVPQGKIMIFFCDGNNVFPAPTAYFIDTLTLADGTQFLPSLNWSTALTSGLFYDAGTGVSCAGSQRLVIPDNKSNLISFYYQSNSGNNGGLVFNETVANKSFTLLPPTSPTQTFSYTLPSSLPRTPSTLVCGTDGVMSYGGYFGLSNPNVLVGSHFSLNPFQRAIPNSFVDQTLNYVADRFFICKNALTPNSLNVTKNNFNFSDPLSYNETGFSQYLHIDCATDQTTLIPDTSALFFGQVIEGSRFLSLYNGLPVTISIGVSPNTNPHSASMDVSLIAVNTSNGIQSCVRTVTGIPQQNGGVFEFSVTFPPLPAVSNFNDLTDAYLILSVNLACGSNYYVTSSGQAGTWLDGLYLVGTPKSPGVYPICYYNFLYMKLESGDQGTALFCPSPQEELFECQRSYVKTYLQGTNAGSSTLLGAYNTVAPNSTITNGSQILAGSTPSFPAPMRTMPSVNFYSTTGTSGKWLFGNTEYTVGAYTNSPNGFALSNQSGGTITLGSAVILQGHYTADADFVFSDIQAIFE